MNKYGAKKVVTPEGTFDSRKEHRRWCELKLLERAGKIAKLRRQVKYVIIPTQREDSTEVYKAGPQKGLPKPGAVIEKQSFYKADFVYIDLATGKEVVEDCKGYKKGAAYDLFCLKRKLMMLVNGIRVKET